MTEIEAGYVAQGYKLPRGWTWARVAKTRAQYNIADIYVPVALGPGVAAWATPMRDNKFLDRPLILDR